MEALHTFHNLEWSCTGIDSEKGNAAQVSLSLHALKLLVIFEANLTGSSMGPMCVKPSYLQLICSFYTMLLEALVQLKANTRLSKL